MQMCLMNDGMLVKKQQQHWFMNVVNPIQFILISEMMLQSP